MALEFENYVLQQKGHQTRMIIFDNNIINGFFSKIICAFRSVYNFSSAKQISRAIKDFNPDVIHVHNLFFIASPSVIYAANKHKVPVVVTLHNYRLICPNALLLRNDNICTACIDKKFPLSGIRNKCYRNSAIETALVTFISSLHNYFKTWKTKVSAFITLNDFSRSIFLHSSLQLAAGKIIVKPNFIPDPGEKTYLRENYFLYAGRITREKGVHILVHAFAEMPDQNIIIIGDGPEKEALKDKFESFPNIVFLENTDRKTVEKYMRYCKAFICPSIWYEGTPLTIAEAFAASTPVIASKLGPLKETVTDGFNGLHFVPGNINDLIKKVRLFIDEMSGNPLFYMNARQTYLEKFNSDTHYKSILKIYNNAIAEYNN